MNTIKNLELIPVTALETDEQVVQAAWALLSAHTGLDAGRTLTKRGLRHEKTSREKGFLLTDHTGLKQLQQERAEMANGGKETYLLEADGTIVGTGSIDRNPSLHIARIAHRLGRSIPLLSKSVDIEGARVSAWAGDINTHSMRGYEPVNQHDALLEAYTGLREKVDGPSWTVEPVSSPIDIHATIVEAGFHIQPDFARYDDFRSTNPVLQGILYQS